MKNSRKLEQHIAVFGESGSGKTVLLSSFYGAAQERENIQKDGFTVVADNPAQHGFLHKNYLGMKNLAKVPQLTRFDSKSYAFQVKVATKQNMSAKEQFNALRVVWHDYPGDWFEQEVSGPEEAARRVGTFRDLLQSDVAIVMVDAQKLLDNSGQEDRYLRSLFANYCTTLLRLRDDLLVDGKPLVDFPRIWVLALSKCDLIPEMNVDAFRDLVTQGNADDIEKFRDVLASLLDSQDALSVCEDFVIFSSASFESTKLEFKKIEVSKRIGLNLLLPLASVFAFERQLHWLQYQHVSRVVAVKLLEKSAVVAAALQLFGGWIVKRFGSNSKIVTAVSAALLLVSPRIEELAKRLQYAVVDADKKTEGRREGLAAVLASFREDLVQGEKARVFQPSLR